MEEEKTNQEEIIVRSILGECQIAYFVPKEWNKKLLVYCHGFRPESEELYAWSETPSKYLHETFSSLGNNGWLVAMSSYRRNGPIQNEAAADTHALLDDVLDQFGQPEEAILLGESMGGRIVTLMAESEIYAPFYQGAIVIGGGLDSVRAIDGSILNFAPLLPIIFLTPSSELSGWKGMGYQWGPKEYVEEKYQGKDDINIKPVIWEVDRRGHCNVNHEEIKMALEALEAWINTKSGPEPLKFRWPVEAIYSPVTNNNNVIEVTVITFNRANQLVSNLRRDDIKDLGTKLSVTFNEETVSCLVGEDSSSVEEGEMVTYEDAYGNFIFGVNNESFESKWKAAPSIGDRIIIKSS